MDKFVVSIPVKAPKGTDPSKIAAVVNKLIGIGLDDAHDALDDPELEEKDDASLATSLDIGQPEADKAGQARAEKQALLAHEVYKAVLDATESFEAQSVGVDLAYLLGAITNPSGEGHVDWGDEPPALLRILRDCLPPGHSVWGHVQLQPK